MNLFYTPTLTELSELIAQTSNYDNDYDIIVDNDGQVLLEPDKEVKPTLFKKFKFYIKGLHGKGQIGNTAAKNLRYLNQLYKNLLFCWENNIKGEINYDDITNRQLTDYWSEVYKDKDTGNSNSTASYFLGRNPLWRVN